MADSGKDHGHPEPVGCVDDFLIADGAAGLDNCRGASVCDGFQTVWEREEGVRRRHAVVAAVPYDRAAGDLPEHALGTGAGGWFEGDLQEAEVLLCREAGESAGGEARGDDSLDEELRDLLGCRAIDLAVDADDAAEGGDGVSLEGALVGF